MNNRGDPLIRPARVRGQGCVASPGRHGLTLIFASGALPLARGGGRG